LFAFCFALFSTFQIDAVYLAFDGFVGMNNLSWLISYIFLVFALYYACAMCWREAPRWAQLVSLGTIALLISLFPFGPGSAAECIDNVIPRSLAEMLYMGVCYVYGIVMPGLIPARAFYRSYRKEEHALVRFRKGVVFAAVVMGITFFVVKLTVSSASFVIPSLRPLAPAGNRLASFAVLALIVLWPLAYAPLWLDRALNGLAEQFQALFTVRDLNPIKAWLDRYEMPMFPYRASWWDCIRNPMLSRYRLFVSILDGRRVLGSWFRERPADVALDRHAWDDLERLHELLHSVPESADFDEMVNGYRNIGRRLRRTRERH
jgi:hypothetical protein